MFTGWPSDATAFLAEIDADNTREFWAANGHRHATAVHGPMRALAAELEPEFGPIRVLRAHRNRRFRPDTPPYRTDTGGVAASPGGAARTVVLSATALTTAVGHWTFDPGQLRRYRVAVLDEPGEELVELLAGHQVDRRRSLRGLPRGFKGDHARIDLLKLLGLQVVTTRPAGGWLSTPEPLERVRAAWRAAAPLVAWLDEHVGPADPVPPRPRPAPST
ncbi:DUF2461 family protein [Pseudonocardia cypriaca]|uniref:Uncharacterized protein (DUF2461 family) n=1 Tax=Pseudonocardia cypriaca TaxID=882449 RepID=A0A543GAY7_9PSEU|nr:DUF2461 family protein [Pseudonocardia cypriaca]TQM43250.1 uncharacterized protein (DUF2461 family) [Pseudonocardia cypriaca]